MPPRDDPYDLMRRVLRDLLLVERRLKLLLCLILTSLIKYSLKKAFVQFFY